MTDVHRSAINTYVVTGPTSGIGLRTALELAKWGTVILVGRNRGKLRKVEAKIARAGCKALSVVCDLSDPSSVRQAATEIIALDLPITGVLNNAGIMQTRPTKNRLGWDSTYATNHLGPFALTEALVPYLKDGANIVFIASAVENPEHKPAQRFGFRGGRFISVAANARGEWQPNGSKLPGGDAYATSKQAILAAALGFARETPRLHFNAVEPGVNPTTSLGHDLNFIMRLLMKAVATLLVPLLRPFIKVLSTPKRAARVIIKVLVNESNRTGKYYDESGHVMLASSVVREPLFQDQVIAQTRAFLKQTA
jgi:NAD(P)-dependent dehydrogenase (short-subunit alcohol dehydrogenase family)